MKVKPVYLCNSQGHLLLMRPGPEFCDGDPLLCVCVSVVCVRVGGGVSGVWCEWCVV